MTEIEALRAAGWTVIDQNDRIRIKPADSMPDVAYAEIKKRGDGMLDFVPDRSHFHRKLMADIAAQRQQPVGEYQPSNYGGSPQ